MLGSNQHRLGWTGQLKQTGNSDRGGYLVKESLGTLIVYVFISANQGFTKFEDKLEYLIELHLKYTIFDINAFQSKSFKSHVTPTPHVALTPSLPVAGASDPVVQLFGEDNSRYFLQSIYPNRGH